MNVSQLGPFVVKVDLQVPTPLSQFSCPATGSCDASFELYDLFLEGSAIDIGTGTVYVANNP
jgi:hypothetical protein